MSGGELSDSIRDYLNRDHNTVAVARRECSSDENSGVEITITGSFACLEDIEHVVRDHPEWFIESVYYNGSYDEPALQLFIAYKPNSGAYLEPRE